MKRIKNAVAYARVAIEFLRLLFEIVSSPSQPLGLFYGIRGYHKERISYAQNRLHS